MLMAMKLAELQQNGLETLQNGLQLEDSEHYPAGLSWCSDVFQHGVRPARHRA